jgi:hypothetical protein
MTASDTRRPGEQTPKQTGNRSALADWVNEGGSFHRSRDSVGDESSAEQKTSYVELRSSDLCCRTPERAARPDGEAVGVS